MSIYLRQVLETRRCIILGRAEFGSIFSRTLLSNEIEKFATIIILIKYRANFAIIPILACLWLQGSSEQMKYLLNNLD